MLLKIFLGCLFSLIALANPLGGRLIYALDKSIKTIDPALINDPTSACAASLIYEGLMHFKPGTAELEPLLASRYEISDNGRVYTFYLKNNVRFSDGSKLEASDVIYSLKRSKYLNNLVENIFAVSKSVVQITLKRPFAPFLNYLCMVQNAIMSKKSAQSSEHLMKSNPVGTGPFKLESAGDYTSFLANEFYHQGSPKLAAVEFMQINKNTIKEARAHIINATNAIENKYYKTLSRRGFNTIVLIFNTKNKALASKAVRSALMMSINKSQLASALGDADVAEGLLPPDALGFSTAIKGLEYDPNAAYKSLKDMGYLHGFSLELATLDEPKFGFEKAQIAAEKIASDLAGLDIKVNIKSLKASELATNKADLLLLNLTSMHADSDDLMSALMRYDDKNYQLDKLVRVARYSMNTKDRAEYYEAAQELIAQERIIYPLVHSRLKILVATNVLYKNLLAPINSCNFYGLGLK